MLLRNHYCSASSSLRNNLGMETGFHGCVGYLRIGDVTYDLSYRGPHIKQQGGVSTCTSNKGKFDIGFDSKWKQMKVRSLKCF